MNTFICFILGYLFGCTNPAALISKAKNIDLRHEGTGNLGATNVGLVIGRNAGLFVMVFDILKAFIAVRLARRLFPKFLLAGLIAGNGAIVGHVFPFHMKFRGGKGLAAFGGMVLAYDPRMFFFLLTLGGILCVIINYSFALPISAGFLFPILAGWKARSLMIFLAAIVPSALVVIKHWSNIGKAMRGEDNKFRETFMEKMFNKKIGSNR